MGVRLRLEQLEDIYGSNIITTTFGNLTSTDVQSALEELQGDINNIVTLSGVPIGSTHLGTGWEGIIGDNKNFKASLYDLEQYVSSLPSSTDLSIGTHTPTTLQILSSSGTDTTLPAATNTLSGLFTSSYKIKVDGIETGATADQNAAEVPVTAIGNLLSTDVQSALEELQSDIDTLNSAGYISSANLSLGTITSTNIPINIDTGTNISLPAATISLAGLLTSVDKTKLDGIESNAKDDQNANEVPVTPVGNLASTNVQTALQELQGDIDTLNSAGYLQNIVEDTTPQLGGNLSTNGNSIDVGFFEDGDLLNFGAYKLLIYASSTPATAITAIGTTLTVTGGTGLYLEGNGGLGLRFRSLVGDIFTWPTNDGSANHYLKTNGAGALSFGQPAASEISNNPIGNLTSTTVQAALDELQGDIDTLNAAGYITNINIGGTGYDRIDLVGFPTWNSSNILRIHNSFNIDSSTFNNTGGSVLTYADVLGKVHIPGTPTSNHIISLPSQTIPASDDYEFWIKGVESGGFKYTLNAHGIDFINIYTGASVTLLDLLDSKLYHVWYDYSANDFYYYVIEEPSAGAASPLTTKGDIWVYTSQDERLGVGSDGQQIVADSSEATGMRWADVPTGNMANATFYDNTGGQTLTTTRTVVNLDTTMTNVGGAVTLASDVITFNETAYYIISYEIGTDLATGTRDNYYAYIQLDTGGGYSDIDGTKIAGYNRIIGEHSSSSGSFTRQFNSGDKIRLSAEATAVNAINTIADATRVSIVQLKGVKGDTGATGSVSPLTTKGDLMGHNGSTEVRVPVGSNGQIVEADSTQSAGWKWAAKPVGFSSGTYTDVSSLHANLTGTPQDRVDETDQVYIKGKSSVTGSITALTSLFVINNPPSTTRYFLISAKQGAFRSVMNMQVASSGNVSTVFSNLSSGDILDFDGVNFYTA